jgi:hypothetical protein
MYMLDHLLGLLLIGLGLRTPALAPRGAVMGDETVAISPAPNATGSGIKITPTYHPKGTGMPKEEEREAKNTRAFKPGDAKTATGGPERMGLRNIHDLIEDREDTASKSQELINRQKGLWEKYKNTVDTARANAIKTAVTRRKAFTSRLNVIKDATKKETLQKLDALISQTNTNRVNAMTEQLTKLDEIITKITAKTTDLKAQGVDTSSVDSLIAKAQTAITAAKTAVQAQAAKEYVIGITTEAAASSDVGRTRTQLEADLAAVRNTIIQARQSVSAVIQALSALGAVGTEKG